MSMIINPYRFSAGGVPGPTPTFVTITGISGSASPSSMNVSWPAGHTSGQLGLLAVQTANQSPSTPSGWGVAGQIGIGTPGSAGSTMITVFWKIATSSSEPAVTITSTADHQLGRIMTISGANSSPIDATNTATGSTSPNTLPAVTTTDINRLIVYFVTDGTDSSANRFSSWTNATLGTVTERGDGGGTSGNGGGLGAGTAAAASAGSTGTGSVNNSNASANYAVLTIAIKPVLV